MRPLATHCLTACLAATFLPSCGKSQPLHATPNGALVHKIIFHCLSRSLSLSHSPFFSLLGRIWLSRRLYILLLLFFLSRPPRRPNLLKECRHWCLTHDRAALGLSTIANAHVSLSLSLSTLASSQPLALACLTSPAFLFRGFCSPISQLPSSFSSSLLARSLND